MRKESIWLDLKSEDKIKELHENKEVDVLIIGGGITGLTTLYYLKDSPLKICLVDQDLVGHGVSGKTTGKINYLQECFYYDISKKYNLTKAKLYLDSQLLAMKEINNIITKEHIACNLGQVTSYVFANNPKDIAKVKFEKRILTKCGIKMEEHIGPIGKIDSLYAISVNDTYVFHPLKYLYSLKDICSKKKDIYERTKIVKMHKCSKGYLCYTPKYTIKATKVILACHYPFFLWPFLTPLKVNIEKSYIVAVTSPYANKTFITPNKPTQSIRYHQDQESYLIYLANSSNICNKLNEKANFDEVIASASHFGNVSYIWKNEDIMTIDKMPYIGFLEKNNPHLLIGTGYNTWGMTNGTLAGMILSDIILGKKNKYLNLYSPLRVNKLSNIGSMVVNMGISAKGYTQNKVCKYKSWYQNISFKKINGQSIAIYKENGKEYMVYNKCPHMGCSLIFNEVEKTWDCPCHASRFDLTGKCLKGPSVYNIEYKK